MKLNFSLLFLLVFSGCLSEVDYYAAVQDNCTYFSYFNYGVEYRPDCREDLESVIPINEESFANVPELRISTLDTIQTLVAYPLVLPPENRILGVAPWSFPSAIFCLFVGPESETCFHDAWGTLMNQRLFNHFVSVVNSISYNPDESIDLAARYLPGKKLELFPRFFTRDIFSRAALLVHESRHGDTIMHELCEDSSLGRECDTDFSGPVGASVLYAESLLNGSFWIQDDNWHFEILDDYYINEIVKFEARSIKNFIMNIPEELKEKIDAIDAVPITRQQYLEWYPHLRRQN